jgi:hypothetical protein
MAKQIGDIILVGTIDDITFYKMDGKGYARMKSRLRGERVKRAKEFARTMQSARRLALGSQLASKVYRSLPRGKQVYGLFTELKSMAVQALKEGKCETEVLERLRLHVVTERAPLPAPAVAPIKKPVVRSNAPSIKKLFGARSGRRHKLAGRPGKLQASMMVQRE